MVPSIEVTEDEDVCIECGARLAAGDRIRAFAITDEVVLCVGCATRRGGAYDDAAERWMAAPKLDALPPA